MIWVPLISIIYSELYLQWNFWLCNSSESHPQCWLTAVYCIFLVLLSIVLAGNSLPLIYTSPSCWMRWTLKHTEWLYISLLIYTDGFSLLSYFVMSQMSSLTLSLCFRSFYSNKSQNTLCTVHMQRHTTFAELQMHTCTHYHLCSFSFLDFCGFVNMVRKKKLL